MGALYPKKKSCNTFPTRIFFLIKQLSISTHTTKLMILLLLNILPIFYPLYLNPLSSENENGIQLVNKNCYTIQDQGEQKGPLLSPISFNPFFRLV